MSKNYLVANAVPVEMLVCKNKILMQMERIQPEDMPEEFISLIDQLCMAEVLEDIFAVEVPVLEKPLNDVQLEESDTLYVVKYKGILPKGTLVYAEDLEIYKFEYHETLS